MKKKTFTLATTATLATIVLGYVAPTFASAATADSADGKGKVEFYVPSKPTPPIDPSVPTTPVNPTDPETGIPEIPGTGHEGPLRLDAVPNFNFGNHPVSDVTGAAAVTYTGDGIDDNTGKSTVTDPTIPYFVQVTDYRGTAEGWDVNVVATPFSTGTTGNNNELTGATVNYTGAYANGVSDGAGGPVNNNPHDKNPATLANGIVTDGTTATNLFGATNTYGTNTSQDVFGKNAAATTLTIPASVKAVQAKAYTSTFTYTLLDTPTNLS